MKNKRYAAIIGIVVLSIVIGVIFYLSQSNQQARTTNTRAEIIQNETNLGLLSVVKQTEFIKKADGTMQDLTGNSYVNKDAYGYGLKLEIKNKQNEPVTLIYDGNTDFCRGLDNNGKLYVKGNNRYCNMGQNGEPADDSQRQSAEHAIKVDFAANETKTITLYRDSDFGTNCGSYQMDFAVIDVLRNGQSTGASRLCTDDPGCFPSVIETQNSCPDKQPLSCNGIEIKYTDPNGEEKTTISNNYSTVIEVKPGTNVTANRLRLTDGTFTNGHVLAFDISCLLSNPATCTSESLISQARQSGYPKALPITIPASTDPTKTGQFNGVLTTAEDGESECAVRIKAAVGPTSPPPQTVQAPALDLKPPQATCYQEDSTVEAKGSYGGHKPEDVVFQVYAAKLDKANFTTSECKSLTAPSPICLIQESTNQNFTANLKGIPPGSYNVFGQVVDKTKKLLCSSNPVQPFAVSCGRSC